MQTWYSKENSTRAVLKYLYGVHVEFIYLLKIFKFTNATEHKLQENYINNYLVILWHVGLNLVYQCHYIYGYKHLQIIIR